MKNKRKLILPILAVLVSVLIFFVGVKVGIGIGEKNAVQPAFPAYTDGRQDFLKASDGQSVDEDGSYDSKNEVALYIKAFGHLPSNYMPKGEAAANGWEYGSLDVICPGRSIGGDRFNNYEKLLPNAEGRAYTECDIDTVGNSSRGQKRIVFSNDGLIFYTEDHYESFTLLYGEP